jgi:hypothetical protein
MATQQPRINDSKHKHGGMATDKDGSQMAAWQTTNLPNQKMVVRQSRLNQHMGQTNEMLQCGNQQWHQTYADVTEWQSKKAPAR